MCLCFESNIKIIYLTVLFYNTNKSHGQTYETPKCCTMEDYFITIFYQLRADTI